ncbi:hypothetical protein SMQ_00556 [Enterococcus faecium EnGen0183]|nr:hypothetical protein SMQ_00556 [Enterococcus faecium EnGen0183]
MRQLEKVQINALSLAYKTLEMSVPFTKIFYPPLPLASDQPPAGALRLCPLGTLSQLLPEMCL